MRFGRSIACVCVILVARAAIADDPAASQPAGGESQVIDASDKAAIDGAMNKEVIVEGVVETAAWSSSGKVMAIRFKNSKETKFSTVVFDKRKADFDSSFS